MLFIGLTAASVNTSEDRRGLKKMGKLEICREGSEKWVVWGMGTHGKWTFSVRLMKSSS